MTRTQTMHRLTDHSYTAGTGWLLAVDGGLRAGVAMFDRHGTPLWCRSFHYATIGSMRRAARALFFRHAQLEHLLVEGGGAAGGAWQREGAHAGLQVHAIGAEAWRRALLPAHAVRSGKDSKQAAVAMASALFRRHGKALVRPPAHDAAEAVMAGVYFFSMLQQTDGQD